MRTFLLLIKKDWRLERRNHEGAVSTLLFALMLTILGSIFFDNDPSRLIEILPGLFWMIFTFSGTLLFSRSFQYDHEHGIIDTLLLTDISAETLFFAKVVVNFLVLMLVGVLLLPLISVFYNFPMLPLAGPLLLVLLLAGTAFSVLGTFCAAMVRSIGMRQVLLPLLFYPLILPVIIAAMESTDEIFATRADALLNWQQLQAPLVFLVACNLVFLALSTMLVSHLIED